MHKRLKQIRSAVNLTQEEFSKKINMSRSNYGSMEIGRITITERAINDICRVFSVNKEWLVTGEGNMFLEIKTDDQFNKVLAEWLLDSDEVTKRTVLALSQLTREEFEFVSRMLNGLIEQK